VKSELKVALIILAAGQGTRLGTTTNKVWIPLSGRRIVSRSLVNANQAFSRARTVLVINNQDDLIARETLKREVPGIRVELIHGGATRHESEYAALQYLAPAIDAGQIEVVLIHDGARPLATPHLFLRIAEAAHEHGGAIPTIPVHRQELDHHFSQRLVRTQTPQGFRAAELLASYKRAEDEGFRGTDTAACMERYYPEVRTLSLSAEVTNVKITFPQDLTIAEHVLVARRFAH
jgi:2-C-methyl-D-erythritol 4-phosphate cytidylyltransferase